MWHADVQGTWARKTGAAAKKERSCRKTSTRWISAKPSGTCARQRSSETVRVDEEKRRKKHERPRPTRANDRSVEDEFRNAWTDVARQFVMEGASDRLRGENSPHELEAVEKKQERNDGRPPLKRRLLGSPPSKSVKKTSSQGLLDVGRFVKKICMELNEPKQPLMRRCVDHLGIDYVQELLDEVQKVERDGGQMTSDGDRKRTPGGVFWNLLKQRLAAEEWEYIYAEEKERQKAIKRRQHSLRRRRKSGNMDVDEVSPPITPTSRDGKTFAEAVGAGGI